MRALRRPAVLPPTLSPKGSGGKRALDDEAVRKNNPTAVLPFPPHWNKPDVRGALIAMHGWACAYCQCKLGRGNRGDVEHFRPKDATITAGHDGYWWLAYAFENYFLACRTCNSERKKGKFPIDTKCRPCVFSRRRRIASERRLLANPALDRVEDWFYVDVLQPMCPVRTAPGVHKKTLDYRRADETIRLLGLNDDVELWQERIRAADGVSKALRTSNTKRAKWLAVDHRPHAFTVRSVLQAYDPALLPTRQDNLRELLSALDRRLRQASQHAQSRPQISATNKRRIKELHWALAVLWKRPPAGSAKKIERWLERKGWKAAVQPLYKRL